MFFNPFYHIYLLQLENYHLRRFVLAAARDCFSAPAETRHPVTWTPKLVAATLLAVLMSVAVSFGLGLLASSLLSSMVVGWVVAVFVFIILYISFFLPLVLATVILLPIDRMLRLVIQKRARSKIDRLEDLTVIAITGSYGKTTMKQTLKSLLDNGERNVFATDESHNTPVAVARSVLNDISEETDIFIVEMGAYGRGDIAQLCDITPPDISILTGINEAHLERFGSLKNTIQTKFEIVTNAPDSAVILNADDNTITGSYEEFTDGREVRFYSQENHQLSDYHVYDQQFHEDGTGISFRLKKHDRALGYAKVSHLGAYIIGNVVAGLCVADVLDIPADEIMKNTHRIMPPEHRLQPIQRSRENILVIDDSYNGNPAGAHAAIATLEKFVSRRTVYVTPGLVEMGERAEIIHKEIGEHLAAVVDVVVLVETSVTSYIKEGLKNGGFAGELYTFVSPQEMHAGISEILQPRDVLLFQNDWPENYR